MPRLQVEYGERTCELSYADGQLLRPRAAGPVRSPLVDVEAAVAAALNAPTDFPALRRALTPEDEVAVVVPPLVNGLQAILTAVLDHIQSAGVAMARISLLTGPVQGRRNVDLAALLAQRHRQVQVWRHEDTPTWPLAYLAGTAGGRAVYLARPLVDAGQVVVIGQLGYDPVFGYRGGLDQLFPTFSDDAARREFSLRATDTLAGTAHTAAADEAGEVGWLLGLPFLVQILEGPGDAVLEVFAGTADSLGELPTQALDQQWRVRASRSADLVVATVSGSPERQSYVEVVEAFVHASRLVRPGGIVAVLSQAGGELGPELDAFRGAASPVDALRIGRQRRVEGMTTLWELASAASQASLYLLSDLPAAGVEELFITPLASPAEAQRLIDQAETTLLLPDAHRCLAELV